MPVASGEPLIGMAEWVDPDDAPEWTDEMFDRAELRIGDTVIRRGPPSGSTKTPTGDRR